MTRGSIVVKDRPNLRRENKELRLDLFAARGLIRALLAKNSIERTLHSLDWSGRAARAARMLHGFSSVCDIGCGPYQLLRYLLPSQVAYYPCDMTAWAPNLEICDLNTGRLPESLSSCDVAVMLGVVEYLTHPEKTFREIARTEASLLVTYNPKEMRAKKHRSWVNAFSAEDFRKMLINAGYRIAKEKPYQTEILWLARLES
jgi:Methyltransferase domain